MDYGAVKAVVRESFLNLGEIPLGLKNKMPLERILNNPNQSNWLKIFDRTNNTVIMFGAQTVKGRFCQAVGKNPLLYIIMTAS